MSDLELHHEEQIIQKPEHNPHTLPTWVLSCLCIIALISSIVAIYICNDLRNQTNLMSQQIETATSNIESLKITTEAQSYMIKELSNYDKTALLDLSSPNGGYDIAKNKTGTFLISLKDVQPHINGGFKATLDIGNISAATFNGFTLLYKWVTYDSSNNIQNHEIESNFTNNLDAGSWESVDLYISPPPTEGETLLTIRINTDRISLY